MPDSWTSSSVKRQTMDGLVEYKIHDLTLCTCQTTYLHMNATKMTSSCEKVATPNLVKLDTFKI